MMMNKPFFVFPFLCAVMVFLSACGKEEEMQADPIQEALANSLLLCPSPAEYHFSGSIFDEVKCMNHQSTEGLEGNSQYISYLSSVRKYDPDRTYFEFGINTSPVSLGDEHLKVFTPTLDLNDLEEIDQVLAVGKKHFSDSIEFKSTGNKGFTVDFLVVESMGESPYFLPSYETYSTKFGKQQGSSIEIVSKSSVNSPNGSSRQEIQLTFLINCKLYDENGLYKGSIKNGVFRPWIVITDSE